MKLFLQQKDSILQLKKSVKSINFVDEITSKRKVQSFFTLKTVCAVFKGKMNE